MTVFEKSAIIGYYRSGATFELIGYIMGISVSYAELIVKEHIEKTPCGNRGKKHTNMTTEKKLN